MGIVSAAAFSVFSMYQRTKGKNQGQLVFVRDIIPPINHIVNWIYILQRKQPQIETDVIRENSTIINCDFRVGDQVMIRIKSVYKYNTSFKVPYEIVQTWTKTSVALRTVAVTTKVSIRCIKPYNNIREEMNVFNEYKI